MKGRHLLLAAVSASIFTGTAGAARTELRTPLITQQTRSWCWAATASMALKFLGFADINPAKNYQCGVVAAAFPDQCEDDCTKCDVPLESISSFVGLLGRYRDMTETSLPSGLKASFKPNYQADPEWGRIKQSLDLSYPVIAGISPNGPPSEPARSHHAVLITGYDDNHRGTGEQWVIVRDPYPYARGENPYARAGYSFQRSSGKAELPWSVLHDRLYLSSAVFLETRSA